MIRKYMYINTIINSIFTYANIRGIPFILIIHHYIVIILVVLAISILLSIFFEYSILPLSSSISIALLLVTSIANVFRGIKSNKNNNIFFIIPPTYLYEKKDKNSLLFISFYTNILRLYLIFTFYIILLI